MNVGPSFREVLMGADSLFAVASVPANQANTQQMLTFLLGAVTAISAVCAAMMGISHLLRKRRAYSHTGLFAGLCNHHGLDRANRQLLKRIARHLRLKHPARLFLEPQLFDPAKLASIAGGNPKRIVALQMRLFAKTPQPTNHARAYQ